MDRHVERFNSYCNVSAVPSSGSNIKGIQASYAGNISVGEVRTNVCNCAEYRIPAWALNPSWLSMGSLTYPTHTRAASWCAVNAANIETLFKYDN